MKGIIVSLMASTPSTVPGKPYLGSTSRCTVRANSILPVTTRLSGALAQRSANCCWKAGALNPSSSSSHSDNTVLLVQYGDPSVLAAVETSLSQSAFTDGLVASGYPPAKRLA